MPAALHRYLLPLTLALCAGASAARDIGPDEALQLRRSGELQALESLLERVRQRHPGARLLEAELEESGGVLVYELDVLTGSGQVRELTLDARSGQFLKDEEED